MQASRNSISNIKENLEIMLFVNVMTEFLSFEEQQSQRLKTRKNSW